MNPWVVCTRPNPAARIRLFCFPYAGGAASIFHAWADRLPSLAEICAIQLPGREGRLGEPLFDRLPPLVEELGTAIRPHLDSPFALFGHSMGAFICFELARWLRERGAPGPLRLFASGCRAPQLPDPEPPIHHLPDSDLIDKLREFDGTPEAVLQHAELMDLFLPILRADLAVHETYVYAEDEPLDCPISAFGGTEDDETTRDEMDGWREQTRASFGLRMFPGNHFFLQGARDALLQAIGQDLLLSLGRACGAGW